MPDIKITDIIIKPNRQRQELPPQEHQELLHSIESTQLLHAPVLREEGDKWVLVAGERRIRAIKEIFTLGGKFTHNGIVYDSTAGTIPYVSMGELTELEAEEAELEENIKRKDLTWQERADAHTKLHKLRQKQKVAEVAEMLLDGKPDESLPKPHTVADTAREVFPQSAHLADGELGHYQDTVRKEIIVAKHLTNPVVAGAKSLDEAYKILIKEEKRKKNIALAEEVGKSFSASQHQLYNVNCIEYMQGMIENGVQVDVILTDPPYGMGADSFGDAGGKMTGIEHHYQDSYESWKLLMDGAQVGSSGATIRGWCELSYLVAKPQAHAYVFCDFDRFHELKEMMQLAGWYVFRTPLVVYKQNSGRVPLPDRGPRRQYEIVLYAIKGNKPTNGIYPDVIHSKADENMSHGAQKPVEVFLNLLQRSARPGDVVADFFCGTGPIFAAANTMQCTAIGCEMNPEYFAMSAQRIKAIKAMEAPDMFKGL